MTWSKITLATESNLPKGWWYHCGTFYYCGSPERSLGSFQKNSSQSNASWMNMNKPNLHFQHMFRNLRGKVNAKSNAVFTLNTSSAICTGQLHTKVNAKMRDLNDAKRAARVEKFLLEREFHMNNIDTCPNMWRHLKCSSQVWNLCEEHCTYCLTHLDTWYHSPSCNVFRPKISNYSREY